MSQILIANRSERGPAPSANDLRSAMERELAELSALQSRYRADCDLLERWLTDSELRERRARELEEQHRKSREKHVLRLAKLHQETMSAKMFNELLH